MTEENNSATSDAVADIDLDGELSHEQMEALYDKSMKQFKEGEVTSGTVISKTSDKVVVDVGFKSEGVISGQEFPGGADSVNIGDVVEVFIDQTENQDGIMILSVEKAARLKKWDDINKVYEADKTIKGKVVGKIKGGLTVDIGLKAFLPGSQIDLRPPKNMDEYLGKEYEYKIIKIATDARAAESLRAERRAYNDLQLHCMPRVQGWVEDRDRPALLLEDLSESEWPPPWSESSVAAVRTALREVAAHPVPAWVESIELMRDTLEGWVRVGNDPAPFLGLGLCSPGWITDALPALIASAETAQLQGESLLHFDIRSDNLCLRDRRAVLLDWNWLARGNAVVDLAAWLPSLYAEGGPPPWILLPESRGLSALFSGYFASMAGLPDVPGAPHVRGLQRTGLEGALPWVVRELGLPPLDRSASSPGRG